MAETNKITEITLYLRGGHVIHLETTGPDDEQIPQMREAIRRALDTPGPVAGALNIMDGTLVSLDDVVAMTVEDVEYVDDPSGPGRVRIMSWDYG